MVSTLKVCPVCEVEFELPRTQPHKKFCSQSCAAKSNNRKRAKIILCINCGEQTKDRHAIYCSNKCFQEYRWELKKKGDQWSPSSLRRYCFEKYGNVCQSCNNREWMGKPIPLEVEHKDGNSDNNNLTNIDWICCNCHALTDTYKSKNKGSGRAYRRQRYQDGKSY